MCNQCSDYRRIHAGKVVFGVFHNGRMQMAYSTEVQAIRSRQILEQGTTCGCKQDDECLWEVFQVDRKSISWEN